MDRVPDRVMLIAARFTCKTNARIDTALFIIVTNVSRARNVRYMYDIVSDADCVLRSRTWFRADWTVRCACTWPYNHNRYARLTARTSVDFGFPSRDNLETPEILLFKQAKEQEGIEFGWLHKLGINLEIIEEEMVL
jgi:hypothetical protein